MEKDKNKEPYNPLPEYLTIGPSDIHGAGILAKEDIPAEVVIGISHVYDPNFQHNYIRTPLGGFINHSEDANCELIEDDDSDYKKLKTIKKIKQNSELTLKYSLYETCNYL
jgi:SET domain-containing protein